MPKAKPETRNKRATSGEPSTQPTRQSRRLRNKESSVEPEQNLSPLQTLPSPSRKKKAASKSKAKAKSNAAPEPEPHVTESGVLPSETPDETTNVVSEEQSQEPVPESSDSALVESSRSFSNEQVSSQEPVVESSQSFSNDQVFSQEPVVEKSQATSVHVSEENSQHHDEPSREHNEDHSPHEETVGEETELPGTWTSYLKMLQRQTKISWNNTLASMRIQSTPGPSRPVEYPTLDNVVTLAAPPALTQASASPLYLLSPATADLNSPAFARSAAPSPESPIPAVANVSRSTLAATETSPLQNVSENPQRSVIWQNSGGVAPLTPIMEMSTPSNETFQYPFYSAMRALGNRNIFDTPENDQSIVVEEQQDENKSTSSKGDEYSYIAAKETALAHTANEQLPPPDGDELDPASPKGDEYSALTTEETPIAQTANEPITSHHKDEDHPASPKGDEYSTTEEEKPLANTPLERLTPDNGDFESWLSRPASPVVTRPRKAARTGSFFKGSIERIKNVFSYADKLTKQDHDVLPDHAKDNESRSVDIMESSKGLEKLQVPFPEIRISRRTSFHGFPERRDVPTVDFWNKIPETYGSEELLTDVYLYFLLKQDIGQLTDYEKDAVIIDQRAQLLDSQKELKTQKEELEQLKLEQALKQQSEQNRSGGKKRWRDDDDDDEDDTEGRGDLKGRSRLERWGIGSAFPGLGSKATESPHGAVDQNGAQQDMEDTSSPEAVPGASVQDAHDGHDGGNDAPTTMEIDENHQYSKKRPASEDLSEEQSPTKRPHILQEPPSGDASTKTKPTVWNTSGLGQNHEHSSGWIPNIDFKMSGALQNENHPHTPQTVNRASTARTRPLAKTPRSQIHTEPPPSASRWSFGSFFNSAIKSARNWLKEGSAERTHGGSNPPASTGDDDSSDDNTSTDEDSSLVQDTEMGDYPDAEGGASPDYDAEMDPNSVDIEPPRPEVENRASPKDQASGGFRPNITSSSPALMQDFPKELMNSPSVRVAPPLVTRYSWTNKTRAERRASLMASQQKKKEEEERKRIMLAEENAKKKQETEEQEWEDLQRRLREIRSQGLPADLVKKLMEKDPVAAQAHVEKANAIAAQIQAEDAAAIASQAQPLSAEVKTGEKRKARDPPFIPAGRDPGTFGMVEDYFADDDDDSSDLSTPPNRSAVSKTPSAKRVRIEEPSARAPQSLPPIRSKYWNGPSGTTPSPLKSALSSTPRFSSKPTSSFDQSPTKIAEPSTSEDDEIPFPFSFKMTPQIWDGPKPTLDFTPKQFNLVGAFEVPDDAIESDTDSSLGDSHYDDSSFGDNGLTRANTINNIENASPQKSDLKQSPTGKYENVFMQAGMMNAADTPKLSATISTPHSTSFSNSGRADQSTPSIDSPKEGPTASKVDQAQPSTPTKGLDQSSSSLADSMALAKARALAEKHKPKTPTGLRTVSRLSSSPNSQREETRKIATALAIDTPLADTTNRSAIMGSSTPENTVKAVAGQKPYTLENLGQISADERKNRIKSFLADPANLTREILDKENAKPVKDSIYSVDPLVRGLLEKTRQDPSWPERCRKQWDETVAKFQQENKKRPGRNGV